MATEQTNVDSALADAWELQRTGNFVAAYDRAQEALQQWPDSQPLQHLSILALASCGSTKAALAAFRASSLASSENEDYLALEARLLKDLALRGSAAEAAGLLAEAAEAYERIAQRTGGSYTAQNAASLWALAGDSAQGARLADTVMQALARAAVPTEEQAAYFHWAMTAEAALVLGDRARLEDAATRASSLCRRNLWARTRTFAQIRRLADLRPACADIIERWYRPPIALVLAGEELSRVTTEGGVTEDPDIPALAYATGTSRESDWQSLAALGVHVHVVLARAGREASGSAASGSAAGGHPSRQASGHGSHYTWSSLLLDADEDSEELCAQSALGLSLGHAEAVRAPWVVLGRSSDGWRQYRGIDRASLAGPSGISYTGRPRYGFVFADAVGYSSLNAADTRRYWTRLLPEAAAAVLRRYSDALLFRKTWGDAIHAVFRTATAAGKAALEMTAATARLTEELELGRRLAFRVAVHFGAADTGIDPVEDAMTFFGPQLSFAARIVPMAPPGGVFVTEPCAAELSLEGAADIDCAYIGTTSLPKDYARVRLLTLSARQ